MLYFLLYPFLFTKQSFADTLKGQAKRTKVIINAPPRGVCWSVKSRIQWKQVHCICILVVLSHVRGLHQGEVWHRGDLENAIHAWLGVGRWRTKNAMETTNFSTYCSPKNVSTLFNFGTWSNPEYRDIQWYTAIPNDINHSMWAPQIEQIRNTILGQEGNCSTSKTPRYVVFCPSFWNLFKLPRCLTFIDGLTCVHVCVCVQLCVF